MLVNDSFEYSKKISNKTCALLEHNKIALTPQNYELWYNYIQGHDVGLVKHVNKILKENGYLTENDVYMLIDKYLVRKSVLENIPKLCRYLLQNINKITYLSKLSIESSKIAKADIVEIMKSNNNNNQKAVDLKEVISDYISLNDKLSDSYLDEDTMLNLIETKAQKMIDVFERDSLTGFYITNNFYNKLFEDVEKAKDDNHELSLIYINIDDFKSINDNYGTKAGDQVLMVVSDIIKSSIKRKAVFGRWGDDELLVLLPNHSMHFASKIAETLRKKVARKKFILRNSMEDIGNSTISIGLSRYHVGEDIKEFIRRSEKCMKIAKDTGKNKVINELDVINLTTSAEKPSNINKISA